MLLVTASGEEHGLIKTIANSVQDNGFKHLDPETKAKAEKEKKEDAKIVKARYINHRGVQERLTKPYCKYAGDPIHTYHLIPGQTYDLPNGFVKEVNDPKKRLARRSEVLDSSGRPTTKDSEPEILHELVPISF
jgi:hypothetical protein